jgi:uncharacterized protein YodC (DUF2158 family)
MDFKAGDTVRLKSGGPLMTVSSVNDQEVCCEWFNDKHQPQLRCFGPALLKKDDDQPMIA